MSQLSERLCLDLSDTLSCDIELLADFLKGSWSSVIPSKSELYNSLLSLCKCADYLVELLVQQCLVCRLNRCRDTLILYEISKMSVLLLTDRSLQ